jgi:tight adherence protein B
VSTLLYGGGAILACLIVALYPVWLRLEAILSRVTAGWKNKSRKALQFRPIENIRLNLKRIGLSISSQFIMAVMAGFCLVVTIIVWGIGDPVWIGFLMGVLMCGLCYTGVLFYSKDFERFFERGLYEALQIGIDALSATNRPELAVQDVSKYARSIIIRREFSLVYRIWKGGDDSVSDIMLRRAEILHVWSYEILAKLTGGVESIRAPLSIVWEDIESMLSDKFDNERDKSAKTAYTRYGALIFGIGGLVGFVGLYKNIAPAMQGTALFGLFLVIACVFAGFVWLLKI